MLNNKKVYILIVAVMCVLCVVGTVKTALTKPSNGNYKDNLSSAQAFEKKELYYKAVYYYNLALSEKENEEIMLKELDAVKKGTENGEFAPDDYETYLQKYLSSFYKSEAPYNIALKYYYDLKEYDKCLALLDDAAAYGVNNKNIASYKDLISKKYKLVYTNYTDVTPFRNYLAAVNLDQKFGLVDSMGNIYAQTAYDYYSPCYYISENEGESRMWAFAKDENRCYLLNINQIRQAYLPAEVESSSGIGDELLSCKTGDKYVYYDINGKKKFDKEYNYASKFITNIAAVNDNGNWYVINTEGKALTEKNFYDIKINGLDECVKNKFVFIKEVLDGKYFAYKYENGKLTKTDKAFDDVDLPPAGGEYIAYKENGKWGFLDMDLNVVIKPIYDDARSFSSGYAGVCLNGKWTIINQKQEQVIESEDNITDISYVSAYDDTSGKSHAYVYVKIDGAWQLMSLYKI